MEGDDRVEERNKLNITFGTGCNSRIGYPRVMGLTGYPRVSLFKMKLNHK